MSHSTETAASTTSKAVRRAQKKVEAAIAHLKCVEENEVKRIALKEQKAKQKAEERAILKEQRRQDLSYQRNQARPLLLQFCLKQERIYTETLLDEFITWKFNPETNAEQMKNLYIKVNAFMNQLPPVSFFPVMVKTMDGTLISLDYSPSLDRQQLHRQLTRLDSDLFPKNRTILARMVEDEKEPVCEGEIFGCMVFPESLVSSSLDASECFLQTHPSLSYQIYVKPEAFFPYKDHRGVMRLPSYSKPIPIVHLFEKGVFLPQFFHNKEYLSLSEMLENTPLYDTDQHLRRYRLTLKPEAIQELVSTFQSIRRM